MFFKFAFIMFKSLHTFYYVICTSFLDIEEVQERLKAEFRNVWKRGRSDKLPSTTCQRSPISLSFHLFWIPCLFFSNICKPYAHIKRIWFRYILYTNNIILNKFNTITVRGQWQWDDIVILAPIYFIRRQTVSKQCSISIPYSHWYAQLVRYISWCNLIVDVESNKRWPYWHFYMLGRFIFDIAHHYTHRRCCLFSNNWQMYDQINLSFHPLKCDLLAVSVFQIAWMKKIIYKYFTIYIFSFKSSIGVHNYILLISLITIYSLFQIVSKMTRTMPCPSYINMISEISFYGFNMLYSLSAIYLILPLSTNIQSGKSVSFY